MHKKLTHAIAAMLALFIAAPAFADGPGDAGPDVAAPPVRAQPLQPQPTQPTQPSAAQGRSGAITLTDVSLNVPQGYRFYSAEEAYAYLQRNSAPAPQGAVLGMIARAGADIREPGVWATVVSYDPIGFVQPETASGLAESNFEADVRTARASQNRPFEGFAIAPAFNADAADIAWAERAGAPGAAGAAGADLRYEQKVLGRYGVACLTSVGAADQMTEIQAAAGDLRGMLSFPDGRRHVDFQPASDQVSPYTVPGLVTGVATPQAQAAAAETPNTTGQTGFGGLAGWFPWVAGGLVVLGLAGYMFTRRRRGDDDDAEESETPAASS